MITKTQVTVFYSDRVSGTFFSLNQVCCREAMTLLSKKYPWTAIEKNKEENLTGIYHNWSDTTHGCNVYDRLVKKLKLLYMRQLQSQP